MMTVQRSIGHFVFFLPEDQRDTWIEQLNTYMQSRGMQALAGLK